MLTHRCILPVLIAVVGPTLLALGCSRDDPAATALPFDSPALSRITADASEPEPPSGLVGIESSGQSIQVWPFTGSNFGTPSDPLNLVFVGKASASRIRDALLSLDGNRPGFPPFPPFNQTWSDGMGGVQTAYTDGDGWLGSVIQLQLGTYGPVRVHLRLFDTRAPFGEDGTWTLGGAHFEILIPGTADHEVLAWEVAEQIVVADLVRSGLLGPDPAPTAVINPEPGYRTTPPVIYNGVPDALKILCGLPPGPSAVPVPKPTDGRATVLTLADEAGVSSGTADQAFALQYRLIIPKPFCSGGPLDYLLVEGPVSLRKTVLAGDDGGYEYEAEIRGHLTATPVDVTKNPPVPIGDPVRVTAHDVQHGFLGADDARVAMQSNRILVGGGAEKQFIYLVVHEQGADAYRERVQCLTD